MYESTDFIRHRPVSVTNATAKAIGDMLESKGAEVHTLDVYALYSAT